MPEAAPVAPVVPVTAPVKNGAAPAAPQTPAEVFKVKVNGQMREYSRSEAERLLSRMGYADDLSKQAKEALRASNGIKEERAKEKERLRKETEAYLRENEVDPEAFARQVLERKVREAQLTPEQRDAESQKSENQKLKEKLAEFEKGKTEEQIQKQAGVLQKHIESELAAAAKRQGLEPGNDSFMAVYEAFKEAVELNLPFDPDRIVEVAKENVEGSFSKLEKAVLSGLGGEALLTRLGPKVVDAVTKARIEQIRGVKARPAAVSAVPDAPTKTSNYINPNQADDIIRKMGRR